MKKNNEVTKVKFLVRQHFKWLSKCHGCYISGVFFNCWSLKSSYETNYQSQDVHLVKTRVFVRSLSCKVKRLNHATYLFPLSLRSFIHSFVLLLIWTPNPTTWWLITIQRRLLITPRDVTIFEHHLTITVYLHYIVFILINVIRFTEKNENIASALPTLISIIHSFTV